MPTGYTAPLVESEEPVPLRDYMLRCVRAMGVCVMQRDEPITNLPPKEFVIDEYPAKAVERAEARLAELQAMSEDERVEAAQKSYVFAMTSWDERRKRYDFESRRLSNMSLQVEGWEPPTPEHEGFKKFMLEQIETSMPYKIGGPPQRQDPEEWYATEVEWAAEDLDRAKKRLEEAQAAVAERNAWIKAFWESLPDPE